MTMSILYFLICVHEDHLWYTWRPEFKTCFKIVSMPWIESALSNRSVRTVDRSGQREPKSCWFIAQMIRRVSKTSGVSWRHRKSVTIIDLLPIRWRKSIMFAKRMGFQIPNGPRVLACSIVLDSSILDIDGGIGRQRSGDSYRWHDWMSIRL